MFLKLFPTFRSSYPYVSWGGSTSFTEGAQTNENRNKTGAVEPRSVMEEISSYSRWEAVKFCRFIENNQSATAGIISDMVDYSVRTGLIPVFRGGDKAWRAKVTKEFREFCKSPTAAGTNDLTAELKVIARAAFRDGEVFPMFTEKGDGTPCLQTLETHVFKNNYGKVSEGFIDGVRYNEAGEPLEYQTFDGAKRPASAILHICEPVRAGQLRVGPAWTSSINSLFDVSELNALAKIGYKLQLSTPVLYEDAGPSQSAKNSTLGIQTAPTADNPGGQRFEKVTGVTMQRVPIGSKITNMRPEYPGQFFIPFKENFMRELCACLRWPYDFVFLGSTQGTQQRTIIEKAKVRIEMIQDGILWPVLQRLMLHWMSYQITAGKLDAVDGWWDVGFRRPRDLSIDLGRDTKAILEEVRTMNMSIDEYFALYGQTPEEEFQKGADSLGVTYDQYRRLWILQNLGEKALAMLDGTQTPLPSENLQQTA
jgi:capsid protein